MTQDRRDTVARAIYMTHWKAPDPETGRAGAPVWENVSGNVREWVLAQADSAIGTLEGMAAPGGTPACSEPDCPDKLYHTAPSPQQPTKEDLDVARKLLANIRFVDDDEDPDPAIELIAAALQSERSAAQRVTDLQRERDSETLRAQGANEALNDAIRERDAATDKARREHPVVKFLRKKQGEGYVRVVISEALRALAPQNPGDAAPHQEGEE